MSTRDLCSVENCERPIRARSWCSMHWSRWWRNGTTTRTIRDPICSVEGCDRLIGRNGARGLCHAHWQRWREHGDPGLGEVEPRDSRPLAEKFWDKVEVIDASGCWEWREGRLPSGYGKTGQFLAHRVAWELTNGPVPNDLWVLHRCDNPPCCNPAHLWLGTHQDNMDDMALKGRGRNHRGER